jgi:transposase
MQGPYLKVIREKCSQALHILDRYHIIEMNKALDAVRAEETRRMKPKAATRSQRRRLPG